MLHCNPYSVSGINTTAVVHFPFVPLWRCSTWKKALRYWAGAVCRARGYPSPSGVTQRTLNEAHQLGSPPSTLPPFGHSIYGIQALSLEGTKALTEEPPNRA